MIIHLGVVWLLFNYLIIEFLFFFIVRLYFTNWDYFNWLWLLIDLIIKH